MKKELIKKLLMKTIREHLTGNTKLEKKSTIAELEKILNEEGSNKTVLNADGSIGVKNVVTSGTLADAILAVFKITLGVERRNK